MRLSESLLLEHEPASVALENLKFWLNENGHTYDRSVFAKESIKAFLFHYVLYRHKSSHMKELVLSGQHTEYLTDIYLHFLTSLPFESLEQNIEVNDLNRAFTHGVAIPLLPSPNVHTMFFTPDDLKDLSLYETVQLISK